MRRAAGASDAVLGLLPQTVIEPASLDEAQAALTELAGAGLTSVFVGGGTQLGLGARPRKLDAVVRTGRLTRVVEYTPADQVVTVEAGVTLASLQEELAGQGQRLALDPPQGQRATLGGIIAANSFGPRRAHAGSVRDLLLGVTLLRADGVRARGGGKVVKNVAGFDLPKLCCGSLGTLGLIGMATFRVHPLPETSATLLTTGLVADDVTTLVDALRAAQLEASAVVATHRAGRWDVAVLFEGFQAGVARQRDRMCGLAAFQALEGAPAEEIWTAHAAARARGDLRLKIAALPTALPQVEGALARLAALPGASFCWYPTLGLGFLTADAAGVEESAALLGPARQAVAALGGSLVLEAAPSAWLERDGRPGADSWGPPPSSLRLHQALKARLDPAGLLAPGRFIGGI